MVNVCDGLTERTCCEETTDPFGGGELGVNEMLFDGVDDGDI